MTLPTYIILSPRLAYIGLFYLMELLQIYFLTLIALIITLIFYYIIQSISLFLLSRYSFLSDKSIYYIFLMYFAYLRLP
jgi:hypothetical protein